MDIDLDIDYDNVNSEEQLLDIFKKELDSEEIMNNTEKAKALQNKIKEIEDELKNFKLDEFLQNFNVNGTNSTDFSFGNDTVKWNDTDLGLGLDLDNIKEGNDTELFQRLSLFTAENEVPPEPPKDCKEDKCCQLRLNKPTCDRYKENILKTCSNDLSKPKREQDQKCCVIEEINPRGPFRCRGDNECAGDRKCNANGWCFGNLGGCPFNF